MRGMMFLASHHSCFTCLLFGALLFFGPLEPCCWFLQVERPGFFCSDIQRCTTHTRLFEPSICFFFFLLLRFHLPTYGNLHTYLHRFTFLPFTTDQDKYPNTSPPRQKTKEFTDIHTYIPYHTIPYHTTERNKPNRK
ncbi:hypothetical protein F4775DRAFT_64556 [Biscogniauxia sp. FL1348]|nr:hypothetical protein F4775DRAFT_64556 [Biscogniauxia sp. FL1348]